MVFSKIPKCGFIAGLIPTIVFSPKYLSASSQGQYLNRWNGSLDSFSRFTGPRDAMKMKTNPQPLTLGNILEQVHQTYSWRAKYKYLRLSGHMVSVTTAQIYQCILKPARGKWNEMNTPTNESVAVFQSILICKSRLELCKEEGTLSALEKCQCWAEPEKPSRLHSPFTDGRTAARRGKGPC